MVSSGSAPFPWESTVCDIFTIHEQGAASSLHSQLTREVYDACVRRLNNGESPGPDQLPNELIKHMPESMHSLLFHFFKLCWKLGKTPHTWKTSITLLFYKKGDPTHPANYRPIALLNTMYKLWTGIICHILSAYCEQHGILSDPQEGFRKHKDCQRQLQYLKLVLKDAKLHNRDLHITLLDIKSAFNSVDHDCLFRILQALGIPQDVLDIIIDLHHGASTCISTNHGKTAPVSLRRGTIQGDSLSPLLFILFLEPLVRWLQVNDRGYRCMSASSTCPHYANVLAAADDLALMSGSSDQMQVQLNEVQALLTGVA